MVVIIIDNEVGYKSGLLKKIPLPVIPEPIEGPVGFENVKSLRNLRREKESKSKKFRK
jgi:hypothetical protein